MSQELAVGRCVSVHTSAQTPGASFRLSSTPCGFVSCLLLRVASCRAFSAMSRGKFQTNLRVDRADFVAKSRKAQGVAKSVMQQLFAEAGPHRKSVVDWGSLKWTDLGFEIKFKEEKTYMNAYAWFARTLGKDLAEQGVSKGDFELNLLGVAAPDTETGNAAGSSGAAPAASVSDNTNTPEALVAIDIASMQSFLPPWASSSPALKLLRAEKPGIREQEHYPVLRRLGSGTFGEVFASKRQGFDVAVKSFKSKEHGWTHALEDASSACLPGEPAPGRESFVRPLKRSRAPPSALPAAHPLVTPLVRPPSVPPWPSPSLPPVRSPGGATSGPAAPGRSRHKFLESGRITCEMVPEAVVLARRVVVVCVCVVCVCVCVSA